MNLLEQSLYNGLDDEFKKYCEGSTLSFKQFLGLQQSDLSRLYDDRGDFHHNLDRYESYAADHESIEGARAVSSVDEIPELTVDQIYSWIRDEEYYTRLLQEIIDSFEKFSRTPKPGEEEIPTKVFLDQLFRCLNLLGVAPEVSDLHLGDQSVLPFYEWMVDRTGVEEKDEQALLADIMSDRNKAGSLHMMARGFATFFTPGIVYNYDNVSVVTQQPRKFYYRGENAFYGSSRPGLYRGRTTRMTPQESLISILRTDECGLFLDNFDAALNWKLRNGTVRYGALMQHYGLKTPFMDITSDLKTALLFACCRTVEGDAEKWRPLRSDEIEAKDSRNDVAKLDGDSRYGIIYRDRTEIEYMRYFLGKDKKGSKEYPFQDNYHEDIVDEIIPIGYQPFMRCSCQHGYALMAPDETYDMYKDKKFGKYRVRLTEDLCQWIFEEMDGGEKVYPNNDIPHIQKYISKINDTMEFSTKNVNQLIEGGKLDKAKVKHFLKDRYFRVMNRTTLIKKAEIDAINAAYPLEEAEKHLDVQPCMKPMIVLFGEEVKK